VGPLPHNTTHARTLAQQLGAQLHGHLLVERRHGGGAREAEQVQLEARLGKVVELRGRQADVLAEPAARLGRALQLRRDRPADLLDGQVGQLGHRERAGHHLLSLRSDCALGRLHSSCRQSQLNYSYVSVKNNNKSWEETTARRV